MIIYYSDQNFILFRFSHLEHPFAEKISGTKQEDWVCCGSVLGRFHHLHLPIYSVIEVWNDNRLEYPLKEEILT